MKAHGVLSIGRIYCDLNFSGVPHMPVLGRELFAEELSLHAGGGAYITACYLAALGSPSYVLGSMPRQPFASIVEQEAKGNGVALIYSSEMTDQAPQLTVAIAANNERAFLTHKAGPALPVDFAESFVQIANSSEICHLHIGELSTLLEYPDLIDHARSANLTISVDCGWDESSFSNTQVSYLLRQVDVFLPNASEMKQLNINKVDECQAPLTVVKQGENGATAYQGKTHHTELAEPQPVVDTIGAGDAFNAGFLSAWLAMKPLKNCLSLGNACGSIAVSRRGGASELPDLTHLLDSTDK